MRCMECGREYEPSELRRVFSGAYVIMCRACWEEMMRKGGMGHWDLDYIWNKLVRIDER